MSAPSGRVTEQAANADAIVDEAVAAGLDGFDPLTVHAKQRRAELLSVKADLERELEREILDCTVSESASTTSADSASARAEHSQRYVSMGRSGRWLRRASSVHSFMSRKMIWFVASCSRQSLIAISHSELDRTDRSASPDELADDPRGLLLVEEELRPVTANRRRVDGLAPIRIRRCPFVLAACPVIAVLDVQDREFINEAAKRGVFACIAHSGEPRRCRAPSTSSFGFAEYHDLEGPSVVEPSPSGQRAS